jgi:EpsI family protein
VAMKLGTIILLIMLVAAGGFGNFLRFTERKSDRPAEFGLIPLVTDDYVGREHRLAEWNYEVLKADTTTAREYSGADGFRCGLFLAYFSSQEYGSQIHSPRHCLPGGGWKILSLEPYRLTLAEDLSAEVNRLVIAESNRRQLMFYWFETRGGIIRNEFELKFDLMKNSLMLRPTDAAIVRVTSPVVIGEEIETAAARMVAYLQAFYPAISDALPFGEG